MRDERPVPQAAMDDPEAVEMLRVWIAQRGLHCVMKVGMFDEQDADEERAWGILLSDVLRHLARAISRSKGEAEDVVLKRVVSSLSAELAEPSSAIRGDFQ